MDKFVISSGHAKYVSGANKYIVEVTEARKVVDQVTEYLKELNCTVHKFHDNTSKNVPDNINTIVRYHNSKTRDLDISVHFNSGNTEIGGVEVLYVSNSGKAIAEKVSKAISDVLNIPNRGAKHRDNLGFLNGTEKAAILIEVCFVNVKSNVDAYNKNFDKCCKAIAESVSGKQLIEKPVVKESVKQVSPRIQTGGLTAEMVAQVAEYFIANKWWAQVQFTSDGENPTALTGGLTTYQVKHFSSWLDERNWWYQVLYT